MYKIIGADGRDYGPVSAADLRQWIAEGRANGQSLVQSESSPDWRALSTFPEFAVELAAAAVRRPAPMPVMPMGSAVSTRTNGMAVAGFILSLLSLPFICCCCLHTPCALLGLIFSCIALSQINHNPLQGGRGLAIAGIILAIVSFLLLGMWWMFGAASAVLNPSIFQ